MDKKIFSKKKNEPIPFYKATLPPLNEYIELLDEIWQSRMLSNFAVFCQRLEGLAAEYLSASYVKAVVSADIGLIITLKALGLPDGAPCYVSDFTFNSTINAALWAKLRPVIVDIDSDTFNIDPANLLNAVKNSRQRGVVLATHVFGNPCDVSRVESISREYGCYLVFDAAHAYGSMREGIHVGRFGDAEVFSLSGTKLVTSAEGGLIATPHQWLADRIVYMRAYGFQHDYISRYVGINGKISELHSALGLLTLGRVEEFIKRRSQILEFYRERLQENVGWQKVRDEDRSTYKDICIRVGSARESVEKALLEDGVRSKRYFVPLHFMELYRDFVVGRYPVSEEIYNTTICIPVYADLDEVDLNRISSSVLRGIS